MKKTAAAKWRAIERDMQSVVEHFGAYGVFKLIGIETLLQMIGISRILDAIGMETIVSKLTPKQRSELLHRLIER